MPPALSDYDFSSDSEADELAGAPVRVGGIESISTATKEVFPKDSPVLRDPDFVPEKTASRGPSQKPARPELRNNTVSKKRQRNTLLDGLDLGNIIEPTDNDDVQPATSIPASSAPSFSHRTRGQSNGMRTTPLYDQKYHPMDDYLRPWQALKHRARYEEQDPDTYDSQATTFEGVEDSESATEADHDFPPNKRRRLSQLPLSQGTRRSSRQTNGKAIYNMAVHPQDEDLQRMEISDSVEDTSDDESSDHDEGMIAGDGNTASEQSAQFSPSSTPLSSIGVRAVAQHSARQMDSPSSALPLRQHGISGHGSRSQSQPFHILEEPLHVQLARESSVPRLLDHDFDDKENHVEGSEVEGGEVNPHDRAIVQHASEYNDTDTSIEEMLDAATELDSFSMAGGVDDEIDHGEHSAPLRSFTMFADHDQSDSMLGATSSVGNIEMATSTGDRDDRVSVGRDASPRRLIQPVVLYR